MMKKYSSAADYNRELKNRGALPEGFRTGYTDTVFCPAELEADKEMHMNMSMILLDEPTDSFAGVFTRNKFPGAPVVLCRKRLESERIRGVVINNKVANVCVETGLADSEKILAAAAAEIGCSSGELMAASTGVIGWRLPVDVMLQAVPNLTASAIDDSSKNAQTLAEKIMTTDRFPKLRSRSVCGGTVTAAAKGAGMIEPNMATMLCFIMTDLDISRQQLRDILPGAVSGSFNRISVDGDQSTSDMTLAISSRKKPCSDIEAFKNALSAICGELAEDIVRNGEGTGHVIRVCVDKAASEQDAAAVGKALVNSPLVKTAVAGNDPNVGRLVSSVGDCCGNLGIELDPEKVEIRLGGEIIFLNGTLMLDSGKEKRLSAYLKDSGMNPEHKGWPEHEKSVDIDIIMGMGSSQAIIIGSDLTHEYVRENADYRT